VEGKAYPERIPLQAVGYRVDKGKLKKVALGAGMRKMLNIIRALLIKGERFNPEYQPLTQKTVSTETYGR
jgi:hypothetical protein